MFSSSARVAASRAASKRAFATAVDTAGFRVAAVDQGQPTSAITFLVKAGSRFEPKAGVAHALKNFAFKATSQRSALRTVREAELYGGVLSSSLSREHLAITAEFLRGDEEYFVELLSSLLTSSKYTAHEYHESVAPTVQSEITEASHNPATQALELAHALAFRSGLGRSLFTSPSGPSITHEDVKAFASAAFAKGNIAVFGTGIEQATLSKLVEKHLASAPAATSPITSSASQYFGGESRISSDAHGPQTVFIGFGTASPASPELSTLASHLSPERLIKWSAGTSPLAQLPAGTSVQPILLPYTDATLFGLLIQGSTAAGVKEAGTLAVKALKEASSSGSVKAEDLKKAVAKAKFAAANAVEGREGLLAAVAPNLLADSKTSLDSIFASLDKVTTASFGMATASLIKAKPTYVAVGDIQALPYADELGL